MRRIQKEKYGNRAILEGCTGYQQEVVRECKKWNNRQLSCCGDVVGKSEDRPKGGKINTGESEYWVNRS